MKVLDGKLVSKHIRKELQEDIARLKGHNIVPGLAVVIVGENPASQSYVRSKERACKKLGIYSEKIALEADASQSTVLELIDRLNKDDKIHGILIQLPLPKHMDAFRIIEAINPSKDVDGFHPINVGKVMIGEEGMKPCTPFGIMKILEYYHIDVAGKHAVILGRSNIVGKPAASLLLEKNATVTICHSKTENLKEMLLSADILVVAVGKPQYVTADMIKNGAVVIDVGINRVDEHLVGDVDYEAVKEKASYLTPVPGGVGPMTITMLMHNTVEVAKKVY